MNSKIGSLLLPFSLLIIVLNIFMVIFLAVSAGRITPPVIEDDLISEPIIDNVVSLPVSSAV